MAPRPRDQGETAESNRQRRATDYEPTGAPQRISTLEKAILLVLMALLVASVGVWRTANSMYERLGDVRQTQQENRRVGIGNRAVGCAGLGARADTLAPCQEPEVLKLYKAP